MSSDQDSMSHLPDELLLHILSFLPCTKSRAQTSLLSHRFRRLWAHHPDLCLPMAYPDDPADIDSISQSFILSVDRCLQAFASPSLRSFEIHLWLPTSCPPAESKANSKIADRWLRFAGLHSVRELTVQSRTRPKEYGARILSSLFCCRSVEDLTVQFCAFPNLPCNFKGFLFLKKLFISCSSIYAETLVELLDCCPVLEDLKLAGCVGPTYVEISTQNLPRLTELLLFTFYERIGASITAPNLSSIHFEGDLNNS